MHSPLRLEYERDQTYMHHFMRFVPQLSLKQKQNNKRSLVRIESLFLASFVAFFWGFNFSVNSEETDINEKIELCVSCHGENGISEDPLVPSIAGQHFFYLYTQLRDYKARRREHEIMTEITAELSKQEMKTLAQYFSEKKWPKIIQSVSDSDAFAAQRATTAGPCVQCHLGGYEGGSRVPRLSGQKASYLSITMLAFKHKKRLNSPAKGSLMNAYSESDIKAMAMYLAGL